MKRMKLKEIEMETWMSTDNETFREYVFPNGTYRIDKPLKVLVRRKPEGDSHRVVSLNNNGEPISHYVPAGWLAIRWEGVDGTEAFDW